MSTLQQWVGILCHFNNNFFLFFQVTPNAPILCWIYETAVALGTKIASKLPCNDYNIFNTYFDLTLNFTYISPSTDYCQSHNPKPKKLSFSGKKLLINSKSRTRKAQTTVTKYVLNVLPKNTSNSPQFLRPKYPISQNFCEVLSGHP